MRARFWGTRGSLPVALRADAIADKLVRALLAADGRRFADVEEARGFVRGLPMAIGGGYGGATSCVEIEGGDGSFVLCDLGSGAREFGLAAMAKVANGERPPVFHIFLSHMHWDHIMGFPFFTPAFARGVTIVIHGGHADIEQALRRQQEEISFPVPFDWLAADIRFETLAPGGRHAIAGLDVTLLKQRHGHDSYGFRFEAGGRAIVYSTDSEHKPDDAEARAAFAAFFRDADLVIFDSMYSLGDSAFQKADWGHSSNVAGVDLCHAAGARRLLLHHHDPTYSDADIDRVLAETIAYERLTRRDRPPLAVICGHDGLEIGV